VVDVADYEGAGVLLAVGGGYDLLSGQSSGVVGGAAGGDCVLRLVNVSEALVVWGVGTPVGVWHGDVAVGAGATRAFFVSLLDPTNIFFFPGDSGV